MPEQNPRDTAEFSQEEILARLAQGKLQVRATEEGSRLVVAHQNAPGVERRRSEGGRGEGLERRGFAPLSVPTLFPEQGAIGLLVVGGFAHDGDLKRPAPFWEDDSRGGHLIWQALQQANLLHRRDTDFLLGRGGFWDEAPPRTQGVAMTYAGFAPSAGPVNFHLATGAWNLQRLQTLVEACWTRSLQRLKIVTIGDEARVLACASIYGMHDIPLFSIAEPTEETLISIDSGPDSPGAHWIDWAANLLEIARH